MFPFVPPRVVSEGRASSDPWALPGDAQFPTLPSPKVFTDQTFTNNKAQRSNVLSYTTPYGITTQCQNLRVI